MSCHTRAAPDGQQGSPTVRGGQCRSHYLPLLTRETPRTARSAVTHTPRLGPPEKREVVGSMPTPTTRKGPWSQGLSCCPGAVPEGAGEAVVPHACHTRPLADRS